MAKKNNDTMTIDPARIDEPGYLERLTKQTVRNMINDIRDLDKVITEISIVTNFSQEDLWKQMPRYSAMAKEYGTSIKGVYEISQLYY